MLCFYPQRQVQDLDSANGALSKAKSQLQMQVDEYKTKLDEETRVSSSATLRRNSCIEMADSYPYIDKAVVHPLEPHLLYRRFY